MTTRAIVGMGIGLSMAIAALPASAQQNAGPPSGAVPREPPRADQPLLPSNFKPSLAFEAGGGVLGYIGGTANLGPAWDVRAIFGITPRIAAEANYLGGYNVRSGRAGSLVYTGIDANFRYNVLLAQQAPVQVFLTGGLGYAAFIGRQGNPAVLTFPVSVGVERALFREVKLGGRFNLRPAVGDNLGAPGEPNPPRGDTWSLTANLGGPF